MDLKPAQPQKNASEVFSIRANSVAAAEGARTTPKKVNKALGEDKRNVHFNPTLDSQRTTHISPQGFGYAVQRFFTGFHQLKELHQVAEVIRRDNSGRFYAQLCEEAMGMLPTGQFSIVSIQRPNYPLWVGGPINL